MVWLSLLSTGMIALLSWLRFSVVEVAVSRAAVEAILLCCYCFAVLLLFMLVVFGIVAAFRTAVEAVITDAMLLLIW